VETRRVCNRLSVIGDTACLAVIRYQVLIGSRNGRVPTYVERRDCGIKAVTEVWILAVAAVSPPPAGIHCELGQVGEPPHLGNSRDFAGRQSGELREINCGRALGV